MHFWWVLARRFKLVWLENTLNLHNKNYQKCKTLAQKFKVLIITSSILIFAPKSDIFRDFFFTHFANCSWHIREVVGKQSTKVLQVEFSHSFCVLLLPSFWLLLASIFRVVGMRPVDETSGGSGAKLREVAMAARRDESQKRNRNFVAAIAV